MHDQQNIKFTIKILDAFMDHGFPYFNHLQSQEFNSFQYLLVDFMRNISLFDSDRYQKHLK
jgi:hypothetical protein